MINRLWESLPSQQQVWPKNDPSQCPQRCILHHQNHQTDELHYLNCMRQKSGILSYHIPVSICTKASVKTYWKCKTGYNVLNTDKHQHTWKSLSSVKDTPKQMNVCLIQWKHLLKDGLIHTSACRNYFLANKFIYQCHSP